MSEPKQYTIDVPEEKIDILRKKLALATFPDELDEAGWDLGAPLEVMKRLAKAWQTFDWRAVENRLNKNLPQFHTEVQADGFAPLDIHFIHQRSSRPNAIPLLFVHGWPGHFLEASRVLEPLTASSDASQPSFHVVAPSLPNFGFSEGPKERGFALAQYAETLHKLMVKLGYEQYVTQAGDWGHWITRAMGILYPDSIKASHSNMPYAREPRKDTYPDLAEKHEKGDYDAHDQKGFERWTWFQKEGRGYNLLQSTKPQTASYFLQDPVALLAWVFEKLHDWTDEYPWKDDEILEWVSIYYFSRAGPGAAHRIYYETVHTNGKGVTFDMIQTYIPHVKIGLAFNPKELDVVPESWGKTMGPVVYSVRNERGGHFYAHEHPELLVRDLRIMFGKGGGAHGVIAGKEGL